MSSTTARWEHVSEVDAREPRFGARRELTEEALAQLGPLRAWLGAYRRSGDATHLDSAFVAARALVAALSSVGAGSRPELEELRWVARTVPEFSELLSSAADEAERTILASLLQSWRALGLRRGPPGWTAPELEAARMLFARTCAADPDAPIERVPAGLRGLTAGRAALQLSDEFAGDEQLWQRALGARYEAVRHSYARHSWRDRGLAELIRDDDGVQRAVTARLQRWLTRGGHLTTLADELEAALVRERPPARSA